MRFRNVRSASLIATLPAVLVPYSFFFFEDLAMEIQGQKGLIFGQARPSYYQTGIFHTTFNNLQFKLFRSIKFVPCDAVGVYYSLGSPCRLSTGTLQ